MIPATIGVMTARLVDLVRSRGGVVGRREAERIGVDAADLTRLAREGALVRVRAGAYAVRDDWLTAGGLERYAVRARAVLRTREELIASHHTALVLAGVCVPGVDLETIHAVDLRRERTKLRTRDGLSVHPGSMRLPTVRDELGDRMVEPAAALVQVGMDQDETTFAVLVDQALARGGTSLSDIAAALDAHGRRRHRVGRLHRLLAAADPLTAGPEASRLRIVLMGLGFRPRLRVPIRGIDGGLLARPELLIGTSIAVVRTAYPPDVLDRLRHVGVAVALVRDEDLDHPERVARAVASGMQEVAVMQRERARGA